MSGGCNGTHNFHAKRQVIQNLQNKITTLEEEIDSNSDGLRAERETRFEAETRRRHAERAAKKARDAASVATEELVTVKQKLDTLQSRLDRATRGQRSALQAAKDGAFSF